MNGVALYPQRGSQAVSIRTRQPCRVNVTGASGTAPDTGFNPHPAALPGEWPSHRSMRRSPSFNPHPAALPGEWLIARVLIPVRRFNPHPAALPGE